MKKSTRANNEFIINSNTFSVQKQKTKKDAVQEHQQQQQHVFQKSTKKSIELIPSITNIPASEIKALITTEIDNLHSKEFHILHQSVKRVYQYTLLYEIPLIECKLLATSLSPLLTSEPHIIVECCNIIAQLAKNTRNIRALFEEGVLVKILELIGSMDEDILLASIKAAHAFSHEGVYLMHFMDKPQSIASIISLVFSNTQEIRDIARQLYYKLKSSREFLHEETFSLADDPWNSLYYKWKTNDARTATIQFAKLVTDEIPPESAQLHIES